MKVLRKEDPMHGGSKTQKAAGPELFNIFDAQQKNTEEVLSRLKVLQDDSQWIDNSIKGASHFYGYDSGRNKTRHELMMDSIIQDLKVKIENECQ